MYSRKNFICKNDSGYFESDKMSRQFLSKVILAKHTAWDKDSGYSTNDQMNRLIVLS